MVTFADPNSRDKDLCFGRDHKNKDNVNVESELLEQCTGIANIIQHPEYDRSVTVLNDICLLQLTTEISYNKNVQPACLPRNGDGLSDDLVLTSGNLL